MQKYEKTIVIFLICCSLCHGLDINKQQRYSPNTDFLLHEAGGYPAPKRDYVAPQPSNNPAAVQDSQQQNGKKDYNSQFPALGTSLSSASRYPESTQRTTANSNTSGKRDYVAPQFPPLKNTQESSGKVKDLVNFYDGKNKDQNVPQKPPSYSSILQNNKPGSTTIVTSTARPTTPTRPTASVPTKPFSFSSVVAGSNKPSTGYTLTTPRPSTGAPSRTSLKPGTPGISATSRPGSPVLPSSIINNNKNNNQGDNTNGPSDIELQTLSEELLRKDSNNAAKYIRVDYQGKTTSQSNEDKAPQPLFTIPAEVWNISTVQKFVPLLDNYERDTLVNEYVTPQERNEENAFMDDIMATSVIRHLMNFLKDKGYVTPDSRQQRDFLKQLWFGLYSRGKGKISSSAFEHIFVSEFKNGDVLGLHNWIYFSKEESANRVNYLGYLKHLEFNDKGAVIKFHFNQQGVNKPVDTMFIGTSPELEIALYTLCFVTRVGNDCNLKLANKDVIIVTHNFRYRSKNFIGSAYPQI